MLKRQGIRNTLNHGWKPDETIRQHRAFLKATGHIADEQGR